MLDDRFEKEQENNPYAWLRLVRSICTLAHSYMHVLRHQQKPASY